MIPGSVRRIAVVTGSLRSSSFNRKLADAIINLAPADRVFRHVEINDLPLYNQDEDSDPPAAAVYFKSQIATSQGVVFVTPEYNRSVPGVLKNALDHGSRPYGKSVWSGKPAALLSVSPGATGGAMAQQHLRNILAYLDMPTLGQPEIFIQAKTEFSETSKELSEDTKNILQNWMTRYIAWVDAITAQRAES